MLIKAENIVFEGQKMFFWVSAIDLIVYLLSIVLDLAIDRKSLILLYIPHGVRGVTGGLISTMIPEVHGLI